MENMTLVDVLMVYAGVGFASWIVVQGIATLCDRFDRARLRRRHAS
jgi:hypothetical protein